MDAIEAMFGRKFSFGPYGAEHSSTPAFSASDGICDGNREV